MSRSNKTIQKLLVEVRQGISAACCPSCARGEPCEDDSDDMSDPYEYLEMLDDNYEDMGIERNSLNAKMLDLEQYLDRQASLYAVDGVKKGVKYVDRIDDLWTDLDKAENIDASIIHALRIPDDIQAALGVMLRTISMARDLARKNKFEAAEQALERAVTFGQAIQQDEMFRDARDAYEASKNPPDMAHRRFAASSGRRIKPATRSAINKALMSKGFDGNGRFRNMAQANSAMADVLDRFGLQIATVLSADLFRLPSNTVNLDVEEVNPSDPFSPIPVQNTVLSVNYTKLDDGRYEVVAYLS